MWWILPWIAKAAVAYTAVKTAETVYDYATTDQEKEGRELGIETAAAIYKPVLESLEARQKKIIAEKDKEYYDAEFQKDFLRDQFVYYEQEMPITKIKSRRLNANTAILRALKLLLLLSLQAAARQSAPVPCSV